MFERFTDRARRVLVYAQEEARVLSHSFIGTEHLLLGLIEESQGVAAQALDALGVTLEAVRSKANEPRGVNTESSPGSPPFSHRAKKVLELSLREALQFGHNYIGTEHLLLGLVRQGEGMAVQILTDLGVEIADVRSTVMEMMSGHSGNEWAADRQAPASFAATPPEALLVQAVRSIGERLRTDLDPKTLDDRASQIAAELFSLLRERWTDRGTETPGIPES